MKGVHHVEFSVLEYEESIEFYDKMFGWLGYIKAFGLIILVIFQRITQHGLLFFIAILVFNPPSQVEN
jgi:catechol 2,3-dioxygenase-like lactoylglutathione lyase family enzyme